MPTSRPQQTTTSPSDGAGERRRTAATADAQDGSKRQAVEIIADTVQFLGSREGGGGGGGDGERQFVPAAATAGNEDFTASSADDDIPF